MKVKYLITLATASILGMGLVTACGNPCAAGTKDNSGSEATTETNPCASKENPCASKANPCASKENPCASKANPCASKANPCAGQ